MEEQHTQGTLPADISVRPATTADRTAIRNVIDGASLELADATLSKSLERGEAYVAENKLGTVIGTVILDSHTIIAIAVRRNRRSRGIGTALVETVGSDEDRLYAEFDVEVAPFWRELGFTLHGLTENRYWALR